VVFFTAAINSDGTIASCFDCAEANTRRLGVGQYQIDFGENVQAVNGWSRWVQADTLTTGSVDAWCNTADRAGDPNAVWVNCQYSGGPGSQGNSAPGTTRSLTVRANAFPPDLTIEGEAGPPPTRRIGGCTAGAPGLI
jgi:hypothetical protein